MSLYKGKAKLVESKRDYYEIVSAIKVFAIITVAMLADGILTSVGW